MLKYGNRIIDISFDVDNQLWGKKQYAAMLLSRFTTRFEKLMFGIIRASFNQRRKTLQNSVSHDSGLGISKELIAENLEKMGLSATIRGEALSLQQFAEFADLVEEARQ